MERLTYDLCIGDQHCWQIKGADSFTCKEVCENQGGCRECPIAAAFNRLAAYEDAMPLERAQELAQAKKDGRLVVLPCKPGQTIWVESWIQGRTTSIEAPDITWIIENTERFGTEIFLTREEAEEALKKKEEYNER